MWAALPGQGVALSDGRSGVGRRDEVLHCHKCSCPPEPITGDLGLWVKVAVRNEEVVDSELNCGRLAANDAVLAEHHRDQEAATPPAEALVADRGKEELEEEAEDASCDSMAQPTVVGDAVPEARP